MESESTISRNIRLTDERARYDAACKKVLSEKIILAWIMKSCAEEFRNVDVKEIADHCIEGTPEVSEVPVDPDEESPSRIIGTDTEDSSVREGTVRYDLLSVRDCIYKIPL